LLFDGKIINPLLCGFKDWGLHNFWDMIE
jgi:hypothetical protein